MEKIVEFLYPQDEGEAARGIRVTVGQASMVDRAREQGLQREAWAWFREATKDEPKRPVAVATLEPGKLIPPPQDPQPDITADDARWSMLNIGLRRAYMLPCVRWIEVLNGSGEWHMGELPAEWAGVHEMATLCPAQLFEAWDGAVRECNPGLFWVDSSAEGKARGGVSVRRAGSASGS